MMEQNVADAENEDERTHEENQSLWWLALSPTIWAIHLLAMYVTVAIHCAKSTGALSSLRPVWWPMAAYTVLAMTGIIATGIHGYRRHDFGTATVPHDFDTPADRHRFIGFAVLLLSGLSLVGVVFVTLPAFFIESCQ